MVIAENLTLMPWIARGGYFAIFCWGWLLVLLISRILVLRGHARSSVYCSNMTMWRLAHSTSMRSLFWSWSWSTATSGSGTRAHTSRWALLLRANRTILGWVWNSRLIVLCSCRRSFCLFLAIILCSLIIFHKLVIAWRVSSAVELLLVSHLLLFAWVMMRHALSALTWWNLMNVRFCIWWALASVYICWTRSDAIWGRHWVLLGRWSLLHNALVQSLEAHICWENTVVHIILIMLAWVRGWSRWALLVLGSNSWSWLSSLGLRDVLLGKFWVFLIACWRGVELSWWVLALISLNRLNPCAAWSGMRLVISRNRD